MQKVSTVTVLGLIIKPDGKVSQDVMTFDLTINQKIINFDMNMNLEKICENMKSIYGCKYHKKNVALAMFPNNTYYWAFYEDNNKSNKILNKVATHIINSSYCNNNISNINNCYGDCYIIHFDEKYNFFDTSPDGFVNSYNTIQTSKGQDQRIFKNRLFSIHREQIIYCLCDDFEIYRKNGQHINKKKTIHKNKTNKKINGQQKNDCIIS
jgi:hypothetical protein